MNIEKLKEFYKKMYKIRRFEETLLELFSENKLSGTTHTCIGQESTAVVVMDKLKENDIVFSNHRCHGHFIAYSDNIKILLAEIMGKKSGVCNGKGGSQHLCYERFFSNGIQGGIVPNAVGMAWAEKIKKTDNIAIVFLGDGTLGQGVVYESINMASVFQIPILFIVEDNGYAMSTSKSDVLAGSIKKRFESFDIECFESSDEDIKKLNQDFDEAILYVRMKRKPFCQIVNTYRLAAHSKGDDFRDKKEIEEHLKKEPLKKIESLLDVQECCEIKKQVELELKDTVEFCLNDETAFKNNNIQEDKRKNKIIENRESLFNKENIKFVNQLNNGIKEIFQLDKNIIMLGEDICDPYGGAFKVTKNISKDFPERIINTPISEAGFIGIGVGLAMNGIKPIIEIMFGDFISLGFDQILNHAVKYNDIYNGQVNVPLLIRIPSGGGRGYGATHSQSLEKFFVGIPHLNIIAFSPIVDCSKLLIEIEKNILEPTLLIENKKMYGNKQMIAKNNKIDKFFVEESKHLFPIYKLSLDNEENADALIITYGDMLNLAMEAAKQILIEEEILVNIICLTLISPLNYEDLCLYIGDEKVIFTLEEGTKRGGWGAEVISGICENLYDRIYVRLGARDCAISCNREEEKEILPNITFIIDRMKEAVYGKNIN